MNLKSIQDSLIQAVIEEGVKLMKQLIGEYFNATCYSISQPGEGSVWISYLDGNHFLNNGQVLSMFYHPTKKHTATTVGKLGQKQSVAGPGQWAYSIQTKGAYGNKAHYNTVSWQLKYSIILSQQLLNLLELNTQCCGIFIINSLYIMKYILQSIF